MIKTRFNINDVVYLLRCKNKNFYCEEVMVVDILNEEGTEYLVVDPYSNDIIANTKLLYGWDYECLKRADQLNNGGAMIYEERREFIEVAQSNEDRYWYGY